MRQLNLIRNHEQFVYLKKLTQWTKIFLFGFVLILSLVLVVMLSLIFILQSQVNTLSAKLPQITLANVNQSELLETATANEKLKTINQITKDAPEYFSQYRYLFNLLLNTKGVNIDSFMFDNQNEVRFTLKSEKFANLNKVLTNLDKKKNLKNFTNIEVNNISLATVDESRQKIKTTFYLANFKMKFKSGFNE